MRRLFLMVLAIILLSHNNIRSQDLEVAPIRISFNVAPGESQSRTVTVKNHGNRSETVTLRMRDFLVNRQGQREFLPAGSTRNSISNWINLNPTFLELQPNETKTIQVNMLSSTDDHAAKWGILSFVSAVERTAFSADAELQTGMSISGRIDIFLYYNPLTGEAAKVEISNLQESEVKIPGQRNYTVNIDNIGNQVVSCNLFLVASDMQTGEEHKFRTIEVISYPQSGRTVELSMPDDLPPGRYALAAILDYPGSTSLKGAQITINVE